ncbi:class I SAM-dependent methyltransferase [Roseomonas sp. PWR1]|uniref:Class I SAM-dependent methyltransferase n=1 Tax=Roseomonas nitratireducens TaxID=2820810 RepID=A0ABS4AUK8_9PROT|nr:class I SAM-dependent methyltransferase [Neoroseomonas nitratireducens]MBP0464533.1 class I SAM-dependent methyltransferase [Neoroseomonas nitratireducens]
MQGDGFLHRYLLNNGGKVLDKWVHYLDVYERHIGPYRGRSPVMLEIGVFGGGSLAMWKAYLGPGARLVGIDIDPACKAHEAEGIEIFTGSQDDPALIAAVLEKYPAIDIVLDDGSHRMEHLRASFELLYPRLAPDGLYLLEDLHTCYWPEYGGGLRAAGSFMEFVKDKLDELNAAHARGAVAITDFTAATQAICVYDSIVAFERRPQGRRQALVTEPMRRGEAGLRQMEDTQALRRMAMKATLRDMGGKG